MNKAQLIELLKDYPDDTQIRVLDGYDNGDVNTAIRVRKGVVIDKSKKSLYLGMHDWDFASDENYDFVLLSGE